MKMLQAQLFFDKDELVDSQSMEDYIMELLIRHKIMGATVIRGSSGFGPNQLLKRPDMLFSFDEIPMVIICIDEEEKIKTAIKKLRSFTSNCFIVTTPVEKW